MRALIEGLIREEQNRHPQQQEVIVQFINTIITITVRNIYLLLPQVLVNYKSTNAMEMLNYIHQHIYKPHALKSTILAEKFNVSATYISEYFKAQTGQSLQAYITAYKLKLIETRLRYSDLQIHEIVTESGFSDASHLNRILKKI